ncbi:MAG: histidine kinase [Vicinamibacteria bacterium]|nr:histidine kinase [Vicinamibacteria bacterium]
MNAGRDASWPRVVAASLAAWCVVLLLHGLATWADQLRRGNAGTLGGVLADYAPAYLPWFVFSAALLHVFLRRADRLADPDWVARAFALSATVFYLPQVGYQVALSMAGAGVPWSAFGERLMRWPAVYWLIDAGLLGLTFAAIHAAVATGESRLAEDRRRRAEALNLELRLELERHRLHALRGQLEPHFLFNALNAIAGLVRGDDRALALRALQQLSHLLRAALAASDRDWVPLGDELDFVRDYAALQQLRHGDRLALSITGEDAESRAADCPPLLLQPLVENAIRHDLECHLEASEIQLAIRHAGGRIELEVTNALRPGVAPNPGLGLGLQATRDRLRLLYGDAAACVAEAKDGRFTVTLRWPASRPEARPA